MRKLYLPLEVDYYQHQKFGNVSEAAELLYIRACCLSKSLMTDGLLTRAQLLFLGLDALNKRITILVKADLWLPKGNAGWQIKGFLKRNLSAEELQDADEKRREDAKDRKRRQRARDATETKVGDEAEPDDEQKNHTTEVFALARTEVDRWNAAFPETAAGLRDELQDQNAFMRLQRDEGKTADDFTAYRAYLERSGDIRYWPRPSDLVRPTKQGTGQEAWAVIEQRIAEEKKPEAAPTHSAGEVYKPAWETESVT